MNTPEMHLIKLIDNARNQAEIEFNARMEQIHKEQLAKKDKEIKRLKGIIKEIKEYIGIDEDIKSSCKMYDVNGIEILKIIEGSDK